MPKLYALRAKRPLRKTFSIVKDKLIASSYPDVSLFSSTEHLVDTPEQLHQAISTTAEAGHCLVKGLISAPLHNASRSGSTSPSTPTEWICLDVDGLPGITTAAGFLRVLGAPFTTTSCVVQYSASMGVKDDTLRCHIFFLLDAPRTPDQLKRWLRATNLKHFRQQVTLNKAGHALRWPLDITTCQNDKLLYVSPPELKPGVTCTFQGERITLLERKHPKLIYAFPSPANLDADQEALRNQLRLAQGLAPLTANDYYTYQVDGTTIRALATDSTLEITGSNTHHGFVHLNLNGGDSWGYYHPEGKPEIIGNFKGEDPIYTPIMLPEYYKEYQASMMPPPEIKTALELKQAELELKQSREKRLNEERANREQNKQTRLAEKQAKAELQQARIIQADECPVADDGYRYIGAISRESQEYYRGRYNPTTLDFELYATGKEALVRHYFASNGQILPDSFPLWDISFRFDDESHVDFDNRKINLYQPTPFMQRATPKKTTTPPPTIKHILHHAVGLDLESYNAFVNWLAYIVQKRDKSRIAWILHGTQGTGKGLLFEKVLTPILGANYVARTSMDAIANEKFNSYLYQSVLTLVDEADVSSIKDKNTVTARLKEYITEPTLNLRKMNTAPYQTRNYTNFLVFSNNTSPTIIQDNDRRWSVAKRQNKPLPPPTDEEIAAITAELPAFTDFLKSYPLDVSKATTPFLNDDRREMQELSRDIHEDILQRVLEGDLEFFFDHRPESDLNYKMLLERSNNHIPHYYEVLKQCIQYDDRISRDGLYIFFNTITGHTYPSPYRFTKHLTKMGAHIKKMKFGNKPLAALGDIKWKWTPELLTEINLLKHNVSSTLEEQLANNVTPINKANRRGGK